MIDARIYLLKKTNKIIMHVKENKLIVFTFPPYLAQLNKIVHTFGTLKNKFSSTKPKYRKY